VQNPHEEKFRKINLENANFKARVGDIIGGKVLLKEVGFEEHGTFLEMQGHDTKRAAQLVSEIEKALSRMN
jgi:PUB domain